MKERPFDKISIWVWGMIAIGVALFWFNVATPILKFVGSTPITTISNLRW